MIIIREFQPGDEASLRALFYQTVRHINRNDYSQAQVEAWAPDEYDDKQWSARIRALKPFIATIDNNLAGYADLQDDGYIDHFFCHKDYQGMGVGKSLMQQIVNSAKARKITRLHAQVSITAKPFFQHFGFQQIKAQQVEIRGQVLTNYVMGRLI
ncbi:GNAT family N-acetyltransferase [Litorilituus sediminis]|uniref:GNAT family N-acetyltransferase n=1 Tax=Litorilituus sediminis TaxID=718192 RepID=A0A4P6PB49_9GAMM|nr:GNAT family N-acetyltransferase [Litorilituus sediminis]QBG36905.1 GNAT family N-acetyltransferase [Litorilituus sediminis]